MVVSLMCDNLRFVIAMTTELSNAPFEAFPFLFFPYIKIILSPVVVIHLVVYYL